MQGKSPKIQKFWTLLGFIILWLGLSSCGTNTVRVSSFHASQKQQIKGDQSPSPYSGLLFPTHSDRLFGEITGTFHHDSIMENQAWLDDQGQIQNYSLYKLPVDVKIGRQYVYPKLNGVWSLSSGEGLLLGLSYNDLNWLQLHAWGSTWIWDNHKLGLGASLSLWDYFIFGGGRSIAYGYAMNCPGGCKVLGSTSPGKAYEFRNLLDLSWQWSDVQFFGKVDFTDEANIRELEAGFLIFFEGM